MENHLNVQKLILNINVSVAIVVQSLYGLHYTAFVHKSKIVHPCSSINLLIIKKIELN